MVVVEHDDDNGDDDNDVDDNDDVVVVVVAVSAADDHDGDDGEYDCRLLRMTIRRTSLLRIATSLLVGAMVYSLQCSSKWKKKQSGNE